MADVTIEAVADSTLHYEAVRLGPVWVDEDTAYVFYITSLSDLVYRKTVDGGATWGARVNVRVGMVAVASVWFDKWTPGDSGDLIHVAYSETDDDDVLYRNLDTSTDTLSAEKTIFDGVNASWGGWAYCCLDITKSRGGNLYCGFWFNDDGEKGFYRSVDNGANWVARADVADGNAVDGILLFPGAEADNNDIWCIYWDRDADEISLKVYDNSGNSWNETSISLNMADAGFFYQMSAAQRASDNHVILAAWNMINNAAADLMVWDIGGAASIVAKTNVLTDSDDSAQCAVFINQQNDDIYVAYLKGSALYVTVGAHYKKSVDGGANWGGEVKLSDNADEDNRAIWAGHSVGDEGGYFMPAWFDDDDDDLFTSTANAVAIAAAGAAPQTLTPSPVTVPLALPAPTLLLAKTLAPDPIATPLAFPAPTLILSLTLAPDPVSIPLVIPTPTLIYPLILTPDPVSIPLAFPAPVVTSVLMLTPDPATIPLVIPAPTLALTLDLQPSSVAIPIVLPAPTIIVGIIYAQFGKIIAAIDPDDYPGGTTLKLLAVLWTSDGAKPVYARLYNVTDAGVVGDSTLNTNSTSPVEMLSSALSLPSGDKTYRIEVGGVAGGTYYCAKAVLRGTV